MTVKADQYHQFTTGGTGIAHSEQNENKTMPVHFLQIWVVPWAQGLPPSYQTRTFSDDAKRKGFVKIITPLAAGQMASKEQEKAAVPAVEETIAIHADMLMGAGIIPTGGKFSWKVGGDVASKKTGRNTYLHVPAVKGGKASVKIFGDKEVTLGEGDGAYISSLNAGNELVVESVGSEEAEVILLDSD